ncbi:hypothetical protein [Methanolapillus africanus]
MAIIFLLDFKKRGAIFFLKDSPFVRRIRTLRVRIPDVGFE